MQGYTMALVAPPGATWREPPMALPSNTDEVRGDLTPQPPVAPQTPTPNSTAGSAPSSAPSPSSDDKNGQNMTCVVCGDKSSGKHYGQFTCEGKNINFFITKNVFLKKLKITSKFNLGLKK